MSALQRIIKSTSDLRNYKAVTLKNKLQCLLVSDLKADKSAAAMNVNVGHLLDPVDVKHYNIMIKILWHNNTKLKSSYIIQSILIYIRCSLTFYTYYN